MSRASHSFSCYAETSSEHAECEEDVSTAQVEQGLGTFGGEVKGCSSAACLVTPVDCALAMGILVVVQHTICVIAGVPVLPKRH